MKEKIKDEKNIKVFFRNPEATMQLKIKGTDNAIKAMKAFDDSCREIRKKELKK